MEISWPDVYKFLSEDQKADKLIAIGLLAVTSVSLSFLSLLLFYFSPFYAAATGALVLAIMSSSVLGWIWWNRMSFLSALKIEMGVLKHLEEETFQGEEFSSRRWNCAVQLHWNARLTKEGIIDKRQERSETIWLLADRFKPYFHAEQHIVCVLNKKNEVVGFLHESKLVH